jgi:polar amino acid transport system substrate-binding protein
MNAVVSTSEWYETRPEPVVRYRTDRSRWQESLVRLLDGMESAQRALRAHAERVENMSLQIASQMGLPGDRLFFLQIAALLHDIGKLGLPTRILDKPGGLSRQEFQLVKAHPVRGEKILREMSLPAEACRAVRCHHERCDGKGYPDGLGKEEIPLEARILGVADACVALTEDRPYRPALSFLTASDWIASLSGIRFDPNVVRHFLDVQKA